MSNLKLNALKDEKMTPRGVTPVSVYSHLFSFSSFNFQIPRRFCFKFQRLLHSAVKIVTKPF